MKPPLRKSQGFTGERIVAVPKQAIEKCREMPLVGSLFITRMGFYPKAKHHYFQRPVGISQAILLCCSGGRGWVQLPQGRVWLQAGEAFVIAPGTPHSYGADAENPWTIHWFHLGGTGCADAVRLFADERGHPIQPLRTGFSEQRNALFDRIFDAFLKGYSTANLLYANLALPYFLASLLHPQHGQPEPDPEAVPNATGRAVQLMRANLDKSITLDNLAQAAHLSISFFSRKFKQDTGFAPIEYFNQLRIQRACQLLHFSELRINEVATRLGIDDPFYFSRLFKKQMGVSPGEYRKSEGVKRVGP